MIHVARRNVELACDVKTLREDHAIKIDDLEQYGRKNSLRIEGIALSDNETNAQLTKQVAESLNEMGAKVTPNDFFRLHRSSKPFIRNGR